MSKNNLDSLCDVIGEENACKLARAIPKKGRSRWLYVPVKPYQDSFISDIIGYPALVTLCDALSGSQMTLGDPDIFIKVRRAREFAKQRMSYREIARKTGLNLQSVYRMLGNYERHTSA